MRKTILIVVAAMIVTFASAAIRPTAKAADMSAGYSHRVIAIFTPLPGSLAVQFDRLWLVPRLLAGLYRRLFVPSALWGLRTLWRCGLLGGLYPIVAGAIAKAGRVPNPARDG